MLRFAIGALAGAGLMAACGGESTEPEEPIPSLSVASGDDQNGCVARPLSAVLVVEARDQSGNPVAGLAVAWTVAGGGGTLSAAASTTDVGGRASVTWTLGAAPGDNTVEGALAVGAPTRFSATAFACSGLMAFHTDDLAVHVMNADGTNARLLVTSSYGPDWSPDGFKVAFATVGEVATINADGSGLVRLTDRAGTDEEPAWSPDGTQIVFTSEGNNTWDLYLMNADGTGVTNVTSGMKNAGSPAWSPDGAKIAFWGRRSAGDPSAIFVIDADGTGMTELPQSGAGLAWSPDGAQIAFGNADQIYLMNPDGSGVVQLTDSPGRSFGPAWAPDGSRIAFVSDRDGNNEIYAMNPDGSGVVRLTFTPGNEVTLSWGQ